VIISLDRQERGTGEVSAIQQVETDLGVPVASIVTLADLLEYLAEQQGYTQEQTAIQAYRDQYGT